MDRGQPKTVGCQDGSFWWCSRTGRLYVARLAPASSQWPHFNTVVLSEVSAVQPPTDPIIFPGGWLPVRFYPATPLDVLANARLTPEQEQPHDAG